MSKTVSFGDIEPIGKTAQLIDPSIELKSVKSRTPTPAVRRPIHTKCLFNLPIPYTTTQSSFISLNAVVRETCTDRDVQIPVKTRENRYDLPHWSPNERIFVEHFYIKFKKALLVGVERAVFDAIDLKKNEVQLSSRREILGNCPCHKSSLCCVKYYWNFRARSRVSHQYHGRINFNVQLEQL